MKFPFLNFSSFTRQIGIGQEGSATCNKIDQIQLICEIWIFPLLFASQSYALIINIIIKAIIIEVFNLESGLCDHLWLDCDHCDRLCLTIMIIVLRVLDLNKDLSPIVTSSDQWHMGTLMGTDGTQRRGVSCAPLLTSPSPKPKSWFKRK